MSELMKTERQMQNIDFVLSVCEKLQRLTGKEESEVFSLVAQANILGVSPFEALTGGINIIKGKVELSARLMNSLIRSRGHSIQVKEITDTSCTLIGKRADNGDEAVSTFTYAEAQKANLTSNSVWRNYTQDMLFARALSRLGRRLFSDVIHGCYVEHEISVDKNIVEDAELINDQPAMEYTDDFLDANPIELISEERANLIQESLDALEEKQKQRIGSRITELFGSIRSIPADEFEKVYSGIKKSISDQEVSDEAS